MTGGRQERNRRAGTENVPAHRGLGVAARIAREKLGATARAHRARCAIGSSAASSTRVPGTAVNGDRDAPRAEHDEHQLRRHRGRVAADRARPRGRRGVDRIGVLVGIARAVARAARDGPARTRARATRCASASARHEHAEPRSTSWSACCPASSPSCAASAAPPRRSASHARRRRDVGRRGFVGRRGPAGRGRPRGHRPVDAALRSARVARGVRVLLQPRRPARRPARRRDARHSRTTSSISRSEFQRDRRRATSSASTPPAARRFRACTATPT